MGKVLPRFCCGLLFFTSLLAHALGSFDPATQCKSVSAETCAAAQALGRGVNMGNMLEAPNEGDWGVRLLPEYIDRVATVFNTVRIPIRWSNHAAVTADATIDPAFFTRVDLAVDQALAKGLYVVIDMHHYSQIFGDSVQSGEIPVAAEVLDIRLINMWRQIAERYRNRSPKLIFELLNEPHGRLSSTTWNLLMPQVLAAVRLSNPTRTVVVASTYWSHVRDVAKLSMPLADRNLIMTFHSYDPMNFTHQGLSWMPQFPLGVTCCSTAQKKVITDVLDKARQWSVASGYPIFVGEFGSANKADMTSREAYTRFFRDEAEKRGIPWIFWEFASSFGMFDPAAKAWREPLRRALLD
jgi:endoglucanase